MAVSPSNYVSATAWVEILRQAGLVSESELHNIHTDLQQIIVALASSNQNNSGLTLALTALQASLSAIATAIANQSSLLANPMIHIKGATNDPNAAQIVGVVGPYGTQICQNDTTGAHWTWDGSSWQP